MKFPDNLSVITLILAALLLIAPVMAAPDGTTQVHIVKYADDNSTILNEMTVDYQWLKDNLPVQGDDTTHYYLQGPVSEAAWNDIHPYKQYDPLNPEEDINSTFFDVGAVCGTDIADICNYVGGAEDGDTITLLTSDGTALTFPYKVIYEPEDEQGPAVLCWHSEEKGYTGLDYTSGMRLAFFADASTNPSGWHIFGNADMADCWDEAYQTYNGTLPSSAAASLCRVSEIQILSQDPPESPVPSFTADQTSGTAPLTVAFTDTSSGAPSAWRWEFGDGAASDAQNPVHTYTTPDTYLVNYTVTLSATNNVGTSSTAEDGYITLTGPYHVPVTLYAGNGGDFTTIQAAVNAAGLGDTIIVKDGSYTENVNVNKTVAICSENGSDNVMVTAAVIEKPVFAIMADGVTIKGFTVRGPTKTPHVAGIESVGYDNCLITDNDCGGRCYNGIHLGGDATNNTITRNYCHNNTQRGISLRDSVHGNYVYNNTCEDNAYQIYVKDGPYDNYVWENTFVGSVECITDNIFHSPEPVEYSYNGITHTGYVGNYYSNYTGADADGDGIGENPVFLGHLLNTETNYYDEYPMMGSWENGAIMPPAPVTEIIWGPYFTGTTTDQTILNWKTDQPVTGTVEFATDACYAIDSAYERSVTDITVAALHHLTLEALTPDTLYHYQVTAGGATTTDHTFRTFPEHGNFTFIVCGDTQLPANIHLVTDQIADEHPLFVLHTGDLVNAVESDSEWNNFFGSSQRMLANTTLYTVPGNHEKNESVYYETTGMPEWYSFDCSDAHFVSLDDNDCADIDAESAWLSQDLLTDANWKFVAHHHPPYSSISSRAGGWILLRQYWGQIMKDAGVTAVFNGHVHAYERCLVDDITYLITGTGAGPLEPLGDEKTDGYQNSLDGIIGYTKITLYTNGTAKGEFVKVGRLSDDNTQVLEVYPPGTIFETYTMTAPGQGADLVAVSLDIPAGISIGNPCIINGTITNTGTVESSACPVTLCVNDITVDTAMIGPLAPGETVIVSFNWIPVAGETILTLGVDPDETVLDLNRTNNHCTATVTVSGHTEPGADGVLTLLPGWNFVSTPKTLAGGRNTISIFEGVDTADHSVLLYTPEEQWVTLGADDEFRPLDGIWIYSNETCEIGLEYAPGSAQITPTKDLGKGWNAIGFTDTVTGSVASNLQSLEDNWATLIRYDTSTRKYGVSIIRGADGRHGEDRAMMPMQGYWVYLDEADTLWAIGT